MDDYKENNGLEPIPEEEKVQDTPDVPEMPEDTTPTEEIQEEENTANEDAGIPITEPENNDEPDEPEMCLLCGEKPADKSFGESSAFMRCCCSRPFWCSSCP